MNFHCLALKRWRIAWSGSWRLVEEKELHEGGVYKISRSVIKTLWEDGVAIEDGGGTDDVRAIKCVLNGMMS